MRGCVCRRAGSRFAGLTFFDKSATGYTGLVNQGEAVRPRAMLIITLVPLPCSPSSPCLPSGATCYLNSLIQTLFMTPEFRQAVYGAFPAQSDCVSVPAACACGVLLLSALRA